MWLIKVHTSQEAPTSTSGSSSLAIIDNATMDTNIDSLNLSKFNETFKDKILGIVTKYGMNELEDGDMDKRC